MSVNPVFIIEKKRDGGRLSDEEIDWFIDGYVRDKIPDYQMSALAMAVYFVGMDKAETTTLTHAMIRSGATLTWPDGFGPVVDKHSTGGVGDKVSLVLVPVLVACGLKVPMLSGRGLGSTGGTLDKLEAIPGFRADLTTAEIHQITEKIGAVITGQTADLVPADRKLYALRDVTATVPSIPLITASIMGKKLAEGLDALVLDVKWGSGAFMKTLDAARALAQSLVEVGEQTKVATSALITDMNQPIGRMVGHMVEIEETIATLQGAGPPDLVELVLALGAELLTRIDQGHSPAAARLKLADQLESGVGFEVFERIVAGQSGRLKELPPKADDVIVEARRDGHVSRINTEELGNAVAELGGARRKVGDVIDPTVGLEMLVRLGDEVAKGQPLVRLFAQSSGRSEAERLTRESIVIGDVSAEAPPLIVERV